MQTATIRTTRVETAFARPAALLAGVCIVASFLLVGVLYGPIAGGALLAVAALGLSMWSLEFGLGFLLATVVFFNTGEIRSISIPFFGGGLRPTDVLTVVILAGWMWRMGMERSTAPLPRRILLPVLAFVSLGMVSVLLGVRNGADYKDSLLELRPILSYLLILPIVSEFRLPQIKRTLWLIVMASWLVAIRSVFLYAQGNGDAGEYTGGRMRVMEIEFTYVLLSLVLVLCIYVHSVKRGVMPILCMLSLFGGLAVTFYRSAFLSLVGCLTFLYYLADSLTRKRWRQAAVWTFAVVLVVSLGNALWSGAGDGFVAALGNRVASIEDYDNDSSAQHRLNEWQAALGLIAHSPVVGAGLGARVEFFSPMYSEDEKPKKGYWSNDFYMHNAYLWLATKMGIAGLALFLFLVGSALRTTVVGLREITNREDRALRIGIASCVVGLLVLSIFGPMFFTMNQAPFAAFCLASLYLMNPSTERDHPPLATGS